MSLRNSTFRNPGKPLKRKTGMRSRSLLKPSLRSKIGKTQKVWKTAKETTFRSEAYLAAVRTLNCVNCGKWHTHTEAAHSNQLRFGKARGLKASDATAMALCRTIPGVAVGCHNLLDQGGKMTKEERNQFEYRCITYTVMRLFLARKLVGNEYALADAIKERDGDLEAQAVYLVSLIESGELKVVEEAA